MWATGETSGSDLGRSMPSNQARWHMIRSTISPASLVGAAFSGPPPIAIQWGHFYLAHRLEGHEACGLPARPTLVEGASAI